MDKKEVVLITGVDGFLGHNLYKSLNSNYTIIGVEYDINKLNRLKKADVTSGLLLFSTDGINEIFENYKIDFVIHTATDHAKEPTKFFDTFQTNVNLGLMLLNHSSINKIRSFINIDTILNKETNFYSFTKATFREYLEFLAPNSKFSIINIRMDMMYGQNAGNHNFIQYMITKLKQNSESIDLTKGEQLRSFLYINDVVGALSIILKNNKSFSKEEINKIDLINSSLNSIQEVMSILKDLLKSKTILNFGAIQYRDNELMETISKNSINDKIPWNPKYSLLNGFKETLNL